MSKFAQVGDFCLDKACADYGKRQGEHQHNIIRFGKTKAGRQRFKCKTCGGTFTETKGTISIAATHLKVRSSKPWPLWQKGTASVA